MGQEEAVLLERPDAGHTEHFCSIRLTQGSGPRGRVVRARVTGADARGLLAEAA
jgi:threonylcarbamoyladenosine tRNA methylthiotransferase MtaB